MFHFLVRFFYLDNVYQGLKYMQNNWTNEEQVIRISKTKIRIYASYLLYCTVPETEKNMIYIYYDLILDN